MDMFLGMDFKWFTGIVEDADNDPLKLGRVRVRIFGIHTDKLVLDDISGLGIPTDKLPWAMPMQSVESAALSGIGRTPVGIVNGSTVVGFARDGIMYQDLIILGTIAGIPQSKANSNIGFNDPSGVYPLEDKLGESDLNRLSRNDIIHEVIDKKNNSRSMDVDYGSGSFDEPESAYNAMYPYNSVKESRSGHIHEIDDTKDSTRLHTYHNSGTYEEIDNNGRKVTKVVSDNYTIIAGSDYIEIQQDENKRINGNINIKVVGNVSQVVDGNVSQTITGDTVTKCNSATVTANESITANSKDAVINTDSFTANSKDAVINSDSMAVNAPIINLNGAVAVSQTLSVTGGISTAAGVSVNGSEGMTSVGDIVTTGKVNANGIDLESHTHTYILPEHPAGTSNTSPSQ